MSMPNPSPSARAVDYPPSGIRQVLERVASYENVTKLTVGEPDFDTPPHIVEAAVRSLHSGNTRYTPNAGQPEYRRAIADRYSREWDVPLTEQNVMVTVGAAEALFLAFSVVLEAGDEILVPDPGYPNYAGQVHLLGAKAVPVPLRPDAGFRMRADDVRPLLTPRTKALLINSPSNPLGVTLTRPELDELVQFAKEHGLFIVSDEVYERIVYDGLGHTSIAQVDPEFHHWLVVNSLSKAYAMTGWRTGFVIGPEGLIAPMPHIQEGVASCVPGFIQDAGIAALEGPDDSVDHMVAEYQRRRDFALSTLATIPGIECYVPEGAFYLFTDIRPTGLSSLEFTTKLLDQHRVAVVPGTAFGESGEGFIRMSYAANIETIDAALAGIKEFLSSRTHD
jgi:aminotransferase